MRVNCQKYFRFQCNLLRISIWGWDPKSFSGRTAALKCHVSGILTYVGLPSVRGGALMNFRLTLGRSRILAPLVVLAMLLLAVLPGAVFAKANPGSQGFYQQTNLVSDI